MHLPQRLSSRAAFVALTLAAGLSAAHADTLNADGQWVDFTVSRLMTGDLGWSNFDGQALSFDFTVAEGFVATLSVVDAGWSGDRFTVTDLGQEIGTTSVAVIGNQGTPAIVDFDEAFADSNFSRGVYSLNAGQHSIAASCPLLFYRRTKAPSARCACKCRPCPSLPAWPPSWPA